ncbi:MAG: hypothetical protein LBL69_03310, partial [Zoogloeaceae bacterium]|nr:hypothetical protein [Zoogloeaceae bacterium]
YRIDRFNPKSSYHLSLGLDYPNAADRKRSQAEKLGGDIFIHGSIRTVGCLPITDDKIKELYLYAVLAKENGQKDIPVYVFPFAMNEANQTQFSRRYAERPDLLAFWQNLRQGYVRFVQTQQALKWQATENGEYRIGE